MRRREVLIFLLVMVVGWSWVILASKDGYTDNNAMIVARSISVTSTIDGQIDTPPPAVGSKVATGDLLARVRNARIDRGRLTELQSERDFLRSEIANAQVEKSGLEELLEQYGSQAVFYSTWMMEDLQLRRQQTLHQLSAARQLDKLRTAVSARMMALAKKSLVTMAKLDETRTEAVIAQNNVASLVAQLSRIDLRLRSFKTKGVVREDGDTSYWAKSVDVLRMRLFDNRLRMSTLRAQLAQSQAQEKVESGRLNTNFVEEHRAPFNGVINAIFTNEGKRVISGTPLMEILDCAHPIVIVPIPEHRFGEFSIGQKATVVPLNSDQAMEGTIQHISSGPLIGRDTTIAVQQTLTMDGSKVIVGFDDQDRSDPYDESCDSARKAIVTIHMRSLFDELVELARTAMAIVNRQPEIARFTTWFQELLQDILPSKASDLATVRPSGRAHDGTPNDQSADPSSSAPKDGTIEKHRAGLARRSRTPTADLTLKRADSEELHQIAIHPE